MKIALVSHHYDPENNAPQRRWSSLVKRFVAAGHEVTVFAPPPHFPSGTLETAEAQFRVGKTRLGYYGESIVQVRFREHGLDMTSRAIDQLIAAADSVVQGIRHMHKRGTRPDVIISTAPGLPSLAAGWLLAGILRRPHVVDMRDAWPDLIGASGMLARASIRRRITTQVANRVVAATQRRARAVVSTTGSFAEVLRGRGAQNVTVIRNGIQQGRTHELPARVDHHGPIRLLYAGTLGRSQGLTNVIRAAAITAEAGNPVDLRILGSGAAEPELRELVERLQAPVTFHGRVSYDLVREHQAWCDSIIISLEDWSPFEWTVPSKLYEALAVRRHVTGVLRGEAAMLISDLDAGSVVAPNAPRTLASVWADLSRDRSRLDITPRGMEWVNENVNHDVLGQKYLDLLESIVPVKAWAS